MLCGDGVLLVSISAGPVWYGDQRRCERACAACLPAYLVIPQPEGRHDINNITPSALPAPRARQPLALAQSTGALGQPLYVLSSGGQKHRRASDLSARQLHHCPQDIPRHTLDLHPENNSIQPVVPRSLISGPTRHCLQ